MPIISANKYEVDWYTVRHWSVKKTTTASRRQVNNNNQSSDCGVDATTMERFISVPDVVT